MPNIKLQSTLTSRYQTTIPEMVRTSLGLNKSDKIEFTIQPNGEVTVSRATAPDEALSGFLALLENDMNQNPSNIQAVSKELVSKIDALVGNIEVNLDAPLGDE